MNSVPKGYRHIWAYKGVWDETKLGKGKGWRIKFVATKGHKHKSMGGFGIGTTGVWKIKGKQFIKKLSKDKYQTTLLARKYPIRFKVKKARRNYING